MNTDKKLKILWFILSLLIVALLITMIVIMGGKKGISKSDGSKSKDPANSMSENNDPGNVNNYPEADKSSAEQTKPTEVITDSTAKSESLVPEKDNSPIKQLIEDYYKAKLGADMNSLKLYVDDMRNVREDDLQLSKKYIEDYRDIECYVLPGKTSPVTVIVKLKYKYVNIDTPAPCIVYLQVVYNEAEKKYYIHNMNASDEVKIYIDSSFTNKERVKDLEDRVDEELEEAFSRDEKLRELYNKMSE